MKIKRRLTMAAAAAAMALGGVLLAAVPANANPLDGTDPNATGCASGASTIGSYYATDGLGHNVGLMEVRYSPSCGTNWVRFTNYVGGYATKHVAIAPSAGYEPGAVVNTTDPGAVVSYSNQIYAPTSCIDAQVIVHDTTGPQAEILGKTNLIWIC